MVIYYRLLEAVKKLDVTGDLSGDTYFVAEPGEHSAVHFLTGKSSKASYEKDPLRNCNPVKINEKFLP